MALYKLDNTIQDYAWGSKTAILQLLGFENRDDKPLAELWMGAHPKAPSLLCLENGEKESLGSLILESPEDVLGNEAVMTFGNRLPYLFKVLAAGSPLSIQAHPNLEQARTGFERENGEGIPLDAFNRSYKDNNHKPEIICALTEFHAMRGFKPTAEISAAFKKIAVPEIREAVSRLDREPDIKDSLKNFFSVLMQLEETAAAELISNAIDAAAEFDEGVWIKRFAELYPGDIGILSPLYLNIVTLKPGQAMFLPAGELHAYLQGTGIELMANSDNVLRGGLTPKYVDVPELISTLTFESGEPEILLPRPVNAAESVYDTAASEFCLSVIELNDTYRPETGEKLPMLPSILICMEGSAEINDETAVQSARLAIGRGESLFITAESIPVLKGQGRFYRASLPGMVQAGGESRS